MTKKRFIKLLMAKGVQRNEAQAIAARYNSHNIPYAKAYSDFLLKNGVSLVFRNLKKQIDAAVVNFSRLIKQKFSQINQQMEGQT